MNKQLPPFLARSIIIRNLDIPGLQKLILHTLNSRANRDGRCYPSLIQLSIDAGLAKSTVVKLLTTLRARGLIIVSKIGNRRHCNWYHLNLEANTSLTPVLPRQCDPTYESARQTHTPAHESARRTPDTTATRTRTRPTDSIVNQPMKLGEILTAGGFHYSPTKPPDEPEEDSRGKLKRD